MSAARIRFLIDENAPRSIGAYLESRGHEVFYVGEHFTKSTPDRVLLAAAMAEGLVVVTFDKDFRQLVKQLPVGTRGPFRRQAGRISLRITETKALSRIQDLVDVIELNYQLATSRQQRFIIQISETSYKIDG
ncbi:hypothetical protein BH23CHL2_BH23CHL2_11180 [soil metagenome]